MTRMALLSIGILITVLMLFTMTDETVFAAGELRETELKETTNVEQTFGGPSHTIQEDQADIDMAPAGNLEHINLPSTGTVQKKSIRLQAEESETAHGTVVLPTYIQVKMAAEDRDGQMMTRLERLTDRINLAVGVTLVKRNDIVQLVLTDHVSSAVTKRVVQEAPVIRILLDGWPVERGAITLNLGDHRLVIGQKSVQIRIEKLNHLGMVID